MRVIFHLSLMLLLLAQTCLAAADAHVLHDAAGEASHHHSVPQDISVATAGNDLSAADTQSHDSDSNTDHMCHHCCHGHSIKSLSQSNLSIAFFRDEFQHRHLADFSSLILTPDSPPPIV